MTRINSHLILKQTCIPLLRLDAFLDVLQLQLSLYALASHLGHGLLLAISAELLFLDDLQLFDFLDQ